MANPLLQNAYSNATEPAGTAAAGAQAQNAPDAATGAVESAVNATAQGIRNLGDAANNALGDAAANGGGLPASTDMWGGYFQALGAVFLLLAVLALAFWLLKRYGPKAGLRSLDRGSLKMESQLPLGPKRNVTVVRFLNKRLVLGVTETQINLLTMVDADHDTEKAEFSKSLARAQKTDSST